MTIPHIKQAWNRRLHPPHGPTGRPPPSPGPGATGRTPSPQPRGPVSATGAALLAIALLGVIYTPIVQADPIVWFEDFEDETLLSPPDGTGEGYVYSSGGANTFVSNAHSNDNGNDVAGQSLRFVGISAGSPSGTFTYSGYSMCQGDGYTFWIYLTSLPLSGDDDRIHFGSGYIMIINDAGGIRFLTTGSAGGSNSQTLTGITMLTNQWVDFTFKDTAPGNGDCANGAATWQSNTLEFSFNVNSLGGTIPTVNSFAYQQTGLVGTENRITYIDDLFFDTGTETALPSNSVAVTGLVGGSMSATGDNIIVRYNSGADVATYNTADLSTPIATEATGCARSDAVVSSNLNDRIFVSYGTCFTDQSIIDTLKIRNSGLGIPTFTEDCEGEPTENVANNADIDVPDNLAQMGTISDMAFDFSECINPTGPARAAFASWTFSSSVDGWIAAFGVAYGQNRLSFDLETSHEENAPALDTSAAPLQVDDFCSWTAPDGRDYIGGVSSDGVAAIYEVQRNVGLDSVTDVPEIDFTFIQQFRNAGVYSGSSGIACAGNIVAIQTPTEIRILGNITTNPVLLHTIPNAASSSRGLALTGSSEFLIYKTPTNIRVFDINTGNNTGSHPTPAGTWHSMESDFAGQNVAVFTTTLITVIDASEATCEINNNCESLGGVGDDDPGPVDPSQVPDGDGGQDFGENIEDNVYFWVIVWIIAGVLLVGAVSWGTRAGFGGLVYLMVSMGIYIIAILLNNFDGGETNVSPWPVVAMVVTAIGFGITQWVRR